MAVRTCTVVIVGIGGWERYTLPCIESIVLNEPKAYILVVDNESDDPYPTGYEYEITRITRRGYAAAINAGINAATASKYYIVLNNDVICHGAFVDMLKEQPSDVMACNTINEKFDMRWADGWHYSIPRRIWRDVGEFDENFKIAAFEDADYTFRLYEKGYKLVQGKQPFEHLWKHNRHSVPGFWTQRTANLRYLIEKHNLDGWGLW